jgi:hypothetical protein
MSETAIELFLKDYNSEVDFNAITNKGLLSSAVSSGLYSSSVGSLPRLRPTHLIAYHQRPTPDALPKLRQSSLPLSKLVALLDQRTGKVVAFPRYSTAAALLQSRCRKERERRG